MANKSEPRAMREIHEIRVQISKEMRGLSPAERNARAVETAREILCRYGLNTHLTDTLPDRPAAR
jgi:hypothetical protein